MTVSTTTRATTVLHLIAVAGAEAHRPLHIHPTHAFAPRRPIAERAPHCPHRRGATAAHQVRAAEEAALVDLMASTATVHARTRVRGLVRARRAAVAVAPGAIHRLRLRVHRPRRLGEAAVVVLVVVAEAALGEAPVLAIRRLRGAAVVVEVQGGVVARVTAATAATAGAGAGARGDEGGGRWIVEGTGEDHLRSDPRRHAQPLTKSTRKGLRVSKETASAGRPATLLRAAEWSKTVALWHHRNVLGYSRREDRWSGLKTKGKGKKGSVEKLVERLRQKMMHQKNSSS
ncbi:hypothetical protein BKA80DRAFT_2595 [Phyllosticta citrichinensis]